MTDQGILIGLDDTKVCKLVDYDFDEYVIENGEDIDPQYNYMVFEDYL